MSEPSWKRKEFIAEITLREDVTPFLNKFPFTIPALRDFEKLEFSGPVTFFVGENGSGKSTMLEAIAVAAGLPAKAGRSNTASPRTTPTRSSGTI